MDGLCSAASGCATTGWLQPSSLASEVWLSPRSACYPDHRLGRRTTSMPSRRRRMHACSTRCPAEPGVRSLISPAQPVILLTHGRRS